MSKSDERDKHTVVPEFLQNGAYFQVCQDTFTSGVQPLQKCFIQIDKYGFFLRWRNQEQEPQLLDCNYIREACNSGYQTKDQKAYGILDSQTKNSSNRERTIILVCGSDMVNYSTFFLMASDVGTAQKWIAGLRKIIHSPIHQNISFNLALKKHWMKLCFMANRENKITAKSITRPFSSGKMPRLPLQILKDLDLANTKNDLVDIADISFDKFYQFYQKVCVRNDIQKVFSSVTGGARCGFIEAATLAKWLNNNQRDPRLNEILFPMYDIKRAKALIKNHEPDPEMANKGRLSLEGFACYLSSLENSAVYRERLTVFEDMDQPLCHYSINSSHNTYLNGRQFMGDSSVEMYRQVLLSGCRCIELDCWDGKGENQGEPIITHGKAMCTDVNFINVLHAINDTAFVVSDYPVILSFENHCSKPLQLKMAKYCEEVFGNKLLKKPLEKYPLESGKPLPSPAALKHKIIIKNKRLDPEVEKVQLERYYRHSEILEEDVEVAEDEVSDMEMSVDADSEIVVSISENLPSQQQNVNKIEEPKSNGSIKKESMKKTDSSGDIVALKGGKSRSKKGGQIREEDEKELLRNYKYVETSSTNIHPLLSSFINYCQSVKFQSFKHSAEQKLSFHMSSFGESAGIGLLKTSAIDFVNYNKRQLSRIYPRGNRVDSSNYMPQVFWNAGCQMVSLNFQTSDLSTQLNQGRFEFNGMSGYLLKPEFMRREDRTFDPFSQTPVDGVIAVHCSIEIISGVFLSDKQIGTYVEVDMYGLPTDTIRRECKTKMVSANGLNPIYNSEPFVFRRVILPSLALLRFAVHDENGKLLGQRVIPLDALQCGYRYISLRSASGQRLDPARLFCHIILKSFVPEGLSDFVDMLADPKKYMSIAEERASQMRNMGIDDDDLDENGKPNEKMIKGGPKGTPNAEHASNNHTTTNNSTSSARASVTTMKTVNSESTIRASVTKTPSDTEKFKNSMGSTSRQYMPSTGGLAQRNSVKDLMSRNPVTVETLIRDPAHQRLVIVQTKEVQKLKGKLDKERSSLEKKHKEKLYNFLAKLEGDTAVKTNTFCCIAPRLRSTVTDENYKNRLDALPAEDKEKVVALQKSQREVEESCASSYNETLSTMQKHHKEQRLENLKAILEETHKNALLELKTAQEKEMAELSNHQTKNSVLGTKEISSDKSIKRAEKERRIREMKSGNVKKFLEERQMMTSKHNRQLEKIETDQKTEAPLVIEQINEYIRKQKLDEAHRNHKSNVINGTKSIENSTTDGVFFECSD